MESPRRVGDIKKRFEVLHEINSNSKSRVSSNIPIQEPVKVSNIPRSPDTNAGVNIKRTPAFRCDKGNKKVNNILKSNNFNNELNNIIDQTVKKFELPTNSHCTTSETSNKDRSDSKPVYNGQSKPTVSRRNHVSKLCEPKLKSGDVYATPLKRPTRPNYLPVGKATTRKTLHKDSESNESAFHSELKKVLSSPLPPGPPPKKPPRTFAHNYKYSPDNEFNSTQKGCSATVKVYPNAPSSLPSSTMRPIRSKTESQIMLKKLENVLKQHQPNSSELSNIENNSTNSNLRKGAKDPIKRYGMCLGLLESEKLIGSLNCNKVSKEEPVYADITTVNKIKIKRDLSNKTQGLHYMSTQIGDFNFYVPKVPKPKMSDPSPIVSQLNLPDSDNGIFEPDAATPTNKKIQSLVNEAYEIALSKNADASSDSDSIHSLPEDTSSTPATDKGTSFSSNQEQLTIRRQTYLQRQPSRSQYYSPPSTGPENHMFECLLLVGIDMDNVTKERVPYLIKKYPPQAEITDHIEDFVFPDASEWPPPPMEEGQTSCYTVIITNEMGVRKYAYCRRVLPEGALVCLPLAYCIISSVKANSFYHRLLEEIEVHHGVSESAQMSLIRDLYSQPYPSPGQSVKVFVERNGNQEKMELIKRPLVGKNEDTDLIKVLDTIGPHLFVQVLGSLLLERKVILLSNSISTLSHCIEGLQQALGPFSWQYTLISLVPLAYTELIESPTPYLVGLLKPYENSDRELPSFDGIQEMFALDLDTRTILHKVGDENSIIPSSLAKALRNALDVTQHSSNEAEKNLAASEAVLRLYVELVGRYNDYIYFNHTCKSKRFAKESFSKTASSKKSTQLFLQWFSITAMFNYFIESKLNRASSGDNWGRFEQLCIQFCDDTRRAKERKPNGYKTVKNLSEKFKELIN
uniref:Suppression of tumorigenicity 5 protein n=2 Tax=Cacopsylla melanoneura TaxID=428564 RepID=A0A8D8YHJ7_9HEMI